MTVKAINSMKAQSQVTNTRYLGYCAHPHELQDNNSACKVLVIIALQKKKSIMTKKV